MLNSLFVSFGVFVVAKPSDFASCEQGCIGGKLPPLREGEAPSKRPLGSLGGEVHVGKEEAFCCDECPIVAELERRLALAGQDGVDFQYDHCACDKVGEEFFAMGYCSDAWGKPSPVQQKHGPRKTGRAYRRKMERKVLRDARERTRHQKQRLQSYANYEYVGGVWTLVGSHICHPSHSKNKKTLKRLSNKKVRRTQDIRMVGNGYRRLFDYRWELI